MDPRALMQGDLLAVKSMRPVGQTLIERRYLPASLRGRLRRRVRDANPPSLSGLLNSCFQFDLLEAGFRAARLLSFTPTDSHNRMSGIFCLQPTLHNGAFWGFLGLPRASEPIEWL